MKCNNCGADYPAKELKCPYCGAPNQTGINWKKETDAAQEDLNKTKSMVIRSAPLYVTNKVLNAILLVFLVLTVVGFIVLFVTFYIEEKVTEKKQQSAEYDVAMEYLNDRDFVSLENYLDEHELTSANTEFDIFVESVILHDSYTDFMDDWMYIDEMENAADFDDYFAAHDYSVLRVECLLEDCAQILQMDSYMYSYDYTENEPLYLELKNAALAYLVGEFGYDMDEIQANFIDISPYSDEFDAVAEDAYARKGWTEDAN